MSTPATRIRLFSPRVRGLARALLVGATGKRRSPGMHVLHHGAPGRVTVEKTARYSRKQPKEGKPARKPASLVSQGWPRIRACPE